MILIGLGGNLPSAKFGPPVATLAAALRRLPEVGVAVAARSRWYRSAPVPSSSQPWFVNAVVAVDTGLDPLTLLAALLQVETAFGRDRGTAGEPWAARVLDLDLLDYDGRILNILGPPAGLILPHPRLQDRAFVLRPLLDIAPGWRHPVSGLDAAALLAAIAPAQRVEVLE
ncbi:MAG TPA: 2-amino-4-hydroxy-6-hydroxymethyldihydropteridine diphosphokinase [Candidatus Cybelea sp.]|nr:2-amino-4-hydroxy-6-hydroxymethyldihydropteridine diphosphokinase [Candidatus Cybelea sp.]